MIRRVRGYEVLDSRGNPTVMVRVECDNGVVKGYAPSGASKGEHEVVELRDNDGWFRGKGVKGVVERAQPLFKAFEGLSVEQCESMFRTLLEEDSEKRKYGGNVWTALSIALFKAMALERGVEVYELFGHRTMPHLYMNFINGGKHAGNGLDVQEFMVVVRPQESVRHALAIAHDIYYAVKDHFADVHGCVFTAVGDEGGFAPKLSENREALELLYDTVRELGYGSEVGLAIDAAANSFHSSKGYVFDGRVLSKEALLDVWREWAKTFKLVSIEDPFAESDALMFKELNKYVKVVADDLITTNPTFIERFAAHFSYSLIKVNQIGSVWEAWDAVNLSRKLGKDVIVSHRSGETCDDFIADFAVGVGAFGLKAGALARGERIAKYNRLMEIFS